MFLENERIKTLLARGWRTVGTKRARTLRRRGESVIWFQEFQSFAWQPPHLKQELSS